MSTKKKIVVMSALVLLLAVTAVFNFVLANTNALASAEGMERGYSWFRYGGTVIRPQRNQKYHARYWNGAFNGDIGIAHRFCGVAGCRTHSQWTNFSAWALDPLANTINWRNLLCCFLCLVDGNATSCIAYHGGACYVGNA